MNSAVVASSTSLSFTTSRDCAAPSRSRGAQRCRHIPRAASRAPHRTAQPRPARRRVRGAPVGVRSVPPPPRCAPRRQGQSGWFRVVCLPLGDETHSSRKAISSLCFLHSASIYRILPFILLHYFLFHSSSSFLCSSSVLHNCISCTLASREAVLAIARPARVTGVSGPVQRLSSWWRR